MLRPFLGWIPLVLLAACVPLARPVYELPVSQRFGLVVPDGLLLARIVEGEVEVTEFAFPQDSPYRPQGLEELGERFQKALEGRGFALRCRTYNALPLLGGPQLTLRMARGGEGVGVFLKPLARPDAYRVEVAPADPHPPLDCPAR
ncbi:hypothetical protein TTMY_0058 [Thermus thermophilus]|uniref:hypothetical protein n=1 Tax=Thermus thermophilus TaxID=274 RepID=UPI00090AD8EC|nr:hypothetical protein [Thermus thermophilus]BAW00472.1 hypothetical protein TTMY_0058 [Thermus thermophilus]BDB11195.1 hypothetical protein TthTMY_09340 [Thermus thermophilus]